MAMQLCFGCLHPFTSENVEPITSFGQELSTRLGTIRSLVAKITTTNAQSRESVASIEEALIRMTLAIDNELKAKQKAIDQLQVQVRFYATQDEEQRKRQKALELQKQAAKPAPRTSTNQNDGPMYASKMLQRFLAASNSTPLKNRPSSEGHFSVTNRFGDGVSLGDRSATAGMGSSEDNTPRRHQHRGPAPPNPLDLVSATLYNTLECVTVKTQAALGIVWLRCEENDEMVAPFVVGAEVKASRYGVPPQHIRVASTIAGTVLTTGIAVNVLKAADDPSVHEVEPLQVALENTSKSTLLIPIFKKYAETDRECHGVLQLIGWKHGTPFSTNDEITATSGAQILSHVMSMYHSSMVGDWTTRTFDPTPMLKVAKYIATLDSTKGGALGPGFGGLGDCISAAHAPYLIFRSSGRQSPEDSAHGFRITKQDMILHGVHELAVRDALKDVHRYATTLEASWKSAVTSQAEMQRRTEQLQEQLDRCRHQLNEAKRNGPAPTATKLPATAGTPVQGGDASFKETAATARKVIAAASHATAPPSARNRQTVSYSAAELEDLEVETQIRLKAASDDVEASVQRRRRLAEQHQHHHAVPSPPAGHKSGAVSSRHGGGGGGHHSTTFLTQASPVSARGGR